MSKKLVIENVSKHFGSLIAVNNVSLDIEPGEFLCFLGPSGCGKTTILRMITGFEQVTSVGPMESDLNKVQQRLNWLELESSNSLELARKKLVQESESCE